jgi:putative oxidoreductase
MLQTILSTERDFAPTMLRLGLGVMMFAHGAQKVLGWFGGPGFQATMQGMTAGLGIPPLFAVLAIGAEFVGGLALIFGLFGRVAALAIGIEMIVAGGLVHLKNGFFMNWTGQQAGEGFELHILVIAMALALVIRGSGAWSVDALMSRGLPALRIHRRSEIDARAA